MAQHSTGTRRTDKMCWEIGWWMLLAGLVSYFLACVGQYVSSLIPYHPVIDDALSGGCIILIITSFLMCPISFVLIIVGWFTRKDGTKTSVRYAMMLIAIFLVLFASFLIYLWYVDGYIILSDPNPTYYRYY